MSPRRAMLATAGAIRVPWTPVVDHCRDVAEFVPAVPAFVRATLASIVGNMLSPTRPIGVLRAPIVQQGTQRTILRTAINAHVLASLTAFIQGMLALTWAAWVLRAPVVQQRPGIARRRSTVLAVFAHC